MIAVDSLTFVFCALMMLVIPLKWLLPCLVAACIHELAHIGAILLCHGTLRGIRVHVGGAVIDAQTASPVSRLFSTLAGPLFSLLLVFSFGLWPQLAVCGLMQGVFNLLPFPNLDGGRILSCLRELWYPRLPEIFFRILGGLMALSGGFVFWRLFFS